MADVHASLGSVLVRGGRVVRWPMLAPRAPSTTERGSPTFPFLQDFGPIMPSDWILSCLWLYASGSSIVQGRTKCWIPSRKLWFGRGRTTLMLLATKYTFHARCHIDNGANANVSNEDQGRFLYE